jgi:hypothetical protein
MRRGLGRRRLGQRLPSHRLLERPTLLHAEGGELKAILSPQATRDSGRYCKLLFPSDGEFENYLVSDLQFLSYKCGEAALTEVSAPATHEAFIGTLDHTYSETYFKYVTRRYPIGSRDGHGC